MFGFGEEKGVRVCQKHDYKYKKGEFCPKCKEEEEENQKKKEKDKEFKAKEFRLLRLQAKLRRQNSAKNKVAIKV